MPHNRRTRHKPKYVGLVSYMGRTKWVGTCSSIAEYRAAEQQRLAELREEVENPGKQKVPTVLEFAEATIHEDGRITMAWPDGQRCQKAESSVARLRDGLRLFVREHGERPVDSFTRSEALTWIRPRWARRFAVAPARRWEVQPRQQPHRVHNSGGSLVLQHRTATNTCEPSPQASSPVFGAIRSCSHLFADKKLYRGARIRTGDLTDPNGARYQAAPRPDALVSIPYRIKPPWP
jgi:hypothetical protein